MKGVVLAGGLGTRFHPVTKVVNKHLLDVFDEPMVFYPIRTLAQAGIRDVTLVTGEDISQFKRLLGDGSDLGVRLSYSFQEGERGIADALSRAEALVHGHPIVRRVNFRAEHLHRLPVDRHAPGQDDFFTGPPRGHSGFGKKFLETSGQDGQMVKSVK